MTYTVSERNQILSQAQRLWQAVVKTLSNDVAEHDSSRPGFLSLIDQKSDFEPSLELLVASRERSIQVTFRQDYPPRISYEVFQNEKSVVREAFLFGFEGDEVVLHDEFGKPFKEPDAAKFILSYLI